MKKSFFLIALLLILSLLASCNTKVEVQDGAYNAKKSQENQLAPTLYLHLEDKNFTFTYDYLSSYASMGKFKLEGDKLIAITQDNEYTFVFKIKDKNTLIFKAEESSPLKFTDGKALVVEGTEFIYDGKE